MTKYKIIKSVEPDGTWYKLYRNGDFLKITKTLEDCQKWLAYFRNPVESIIHEEIVEEVEDGPLKD